ncbi:beta-glucanase [Streptomyces sp. 8N706]|uniref:beta-glucanase n=1 Tax=Streptomyces sp. 8N706 TaxID=3457416 RepID=UPI003FD529AA
MTEFSSALIGWIRRGLTTGTTPPAPPAQARPSGRLVFAADFSSYDQWVAGRTWAYPKGGPTNRGDDKLDFLVSDPAYARTGTFRATRRRDGLWNAGLLTTEGSARDFTVRTGDTLTARIRLPVERGAWPAIWTWRDGGNEIDVFEYHPDEPHVLELSNHVRRGGRCYADRAIRPGAWVDVSVEFGAASVIWWVNGVRVHADRSGVGRGWFAHLIVNLSVSAGDRHPTPDASVSSLSYAVDQLCVYRP